MKRVVNVTILDARLHQTSFYVMPGTLGKKISASPSPFAELYPNDEAGAEPDHAQPGGAAATAAVAAGPAATDDDDDDYGTDEDEEPNCRRRVGQSTCDHTRS